jgi:hypothetical protein
MVAGACTAPENKVTIRPPTVKIRLFPLLSFVFPTAFVPKYCFLLDMVITHGPGLYAT